MESDPETLNLSPQIRRPKPLRRTLLGLGFRVQGSGFGVRGSGFGVRGSGFGVWGLGFGVWGLGFGVWGLGFGVWGLGFGVWAADTVHRGFSIKARALKNSTTFGFRS